MSYTSTHRWSALIVFASIMGLLTACNVRDPRAEEPALDAAGADTPRQTNPCDDICPAPPGGEVATCSEATCEFLCAPGFLDRNEDLSRGLDGDGCESRCSPTNGGQEVCDGQDNDCNGLVDDDLTRACGSSQGACSAGEQTCVEGVWGECIGAVEPADAELCDGIDNDCDGDVDEDLTQECGISVGRCRKGSRECFAGEWGPCDGEIEPSFETCNGADDDCDGDVDEDVKIEYYEDRDDDGYGTAPLLACGPSGFHRALAGGDCDDHDATINPGRPESCNNPDEDRDCDNQPACGDSDCDGRTCRAGLALGTCVNGRCQVD